MREGKSRVHTYLMLTASLAVTLFMVSAAPHAVADPEPPSWSSFVQASFWGVDLQPTLTDLHCTYDLDLRTVAKIYLGTNEYRINWIQAFFVVSQDEQTDFTATEDSAPPDWRWEEKSMPGRIAGWIGTGNTRMWRPDLGSPSHKTFAFNDFVIDGNAVLPGYHIAYQDGSREVSGWYKGLTIPEASSLAGLGGALLASVVLLLRRRSSR